MSSTAIRPKSKPALVSNSSETPLALKSVTPVQAGAAFLARAVSLHLAGKRDEALQQLQRAIQSGEASPEIHRAMGHILFEQGKHEEAAAAYRVSVQDGQPISERKLAEMFGKTSRRWARNRMAEARQSPVPV